METDPIPKWVFKYFIDFVVFFVVIIPLFLLVKDWVFLIGSIAVLLIYTVLRNSIVKMNDEDWEEFNQRNDEN